METRFYVKKWVDIFFTAKLREAFSPNQQNCFIKLRELFSNKKRKLYYE